MQRNISIRFCLILVVLALALVACGGGASSGGGGKPEDATKAFFEAVFTGKGNAGDLVCSSAKAQVEQMQKSFDQVKTAMTASGGQLDLSGLTYTKTTESGDNATVEVAGKMKVSVGGQTQEQEFPKVPVPMKKENNAWKVCA